MGVQAHILTKGHLAVLYYIVVSIVVLEEPFIPALSHSPFSQSKTFYYFFNVCYYYVNTTVLYYTLLTYTKAKSPSTTIRRRFQ